LNSTYTIGVCANVLPENQTEYAGAIENTQDNQTIIIGRYNSSELMSGGVYGHPYLSQFIRKHFLPSVFTSDKWLNLKFRVYKAILIRVSFRLF